ncbi:hypothetical protein OAD94_02155 [Amylibacter sp.]|nr:hypothetical protein [Amylibacter sp.]
MQKEFYDPAKPDGQNNSIKDPISHNGIGKIGKRYLIPARQGRAVRLKKIKLFPYTILEVIKYVIFLH